MKLQVNYTPQFIIIIIIIIVPFKNHEPHPLPPHHRSNVTTIHITVRKHDTEFVQQPTKSTSALFFRPSCMDHIHFTTEEKTRTSSA